MLPDLLVDPPPLAFLQRNDRTLVGPLRAEGLVGLHLGAEGQHRVAPGLPELARKREGPRQGLVEEVLLGVFRGAPAAPVARRGPGDGAEGDRVAAGGALEVVEQAVGQGDRHGGAVGVWELMVWRVLG